MTPIDHPPYRSVSFCRIGHRYSVREHWVMGGEPKLLMPDGFLWGVMLSAIVGESIPAETFREGNRIVMTRSRDEEHAGAIGTILHIDPVPIPRRAIAVLAGGTRVVVYLEDADLLESVL